MPQRESELTRVAAYGLVVDRNQILLCRISDRLPKHAGYWTLPGGGIDFGEDPADAMVREVYEETGLAVRSSGVAAIDSGVVQDGSQTTHTVRILYHVVVLGGTLTNELDGTTDACAWHEISAVGDLPIVDLVEVGRSVLAR